MENPNYAQILSERILSLRKEKVLTQEALAQQLGVSFQAVSKWENEQSCPDIALLPLLADIFEVPIDSLFGRQAPVPETPPEKEEPATETTARHEPEWGNEPVFSACGALPWPDDRELRGVLCWGRKILSHQKPLNKLFTFDVKKSEYTWLLRYSPLNVTAECGLHVEGDIQGKAVAGSHIHCNDILGNATAGSHIHCNDIKENANAGSHIGCNDIGGSANAGSHIECNDVGGNVGAGNSVECGNVGGNVKATKVVMRK